MINKKLLSFDPAAMRYVWRCVLCQWLSLLCNVAFVWALAGIVGGALGARLAAGAWPAAFAVCMISIPLRIVCTTRASAMSDKASAGVKRTLRAKIYQKMLALGTNYSETVATSEAVMLASEGVEQIDTYFARYLPQLFYSLLAPLTLFVLLAPVHLRSALVLLVCVPLIPMSIVAVQKFAKKLLDKYWGEYTSLGDDFLENIQGLTTLKIYGADGWKHEQMNEHAERFRKITMRVLTMQLNSVTLMDLLAYGGAALGIISAVAAFAAGQLELAGCLAIVLLAADFFLPLRLLGSYFHIAMNGAASAEKIFKLLAAPEQPDGTRNQPQAESVALRVEHLNFAYQPERPILQDVNLNFPAGSFTALVGESGCGKSTVAGILAGSLTPSSGRVTANGMPVTQLTRAARMQAMTLVPHDAKLFKGTVETNMRMAAPNASEPELWAALEEVNLAAFCREQQGLQTPVTENGANLSGGQRQRLGLARALLHNSPVYLFDEATSNIDAESEDDIMSAIRAMRGKRTVILISHRLANVMDCDTIYTFAAGHVVEQGSHAQLLAAGGEYSRLYNAQRALEQYGQKGE
ncbi:ABC transporter ATP-binding protein/permease [Gemmiger sp.]|uniref:ABC transporter ATP-binding protein/permease n=1 Tax=Gemmiger sp. TaxID=2049027 RepID=UPI0025B814D7|nr:ABC transporter ATP-binding protein/permease [Gemmiger sp.]